MQARSTRNGITSTGTIPRSTAKLAFAVVATRATMEHDYLLKRTNINAVTKKQKTRRKVV